MRNSIAVRFVVSFLLSLLGLGVIALLIWTSMSDMQAALLRYATKSEMLTAVGSAEQGFASAQRATVLDLRQDNQALRRFALDQYGEVEAQLQTLADLPDDLRFLDADILQLRDDIAAYRALYAEATQVQQAIAETGLELHTTFNRASGVVTLMLDPGSDPVTTTRIAARTFEGARALIAQRDYRSNMPLLAVLEEELQRTERVLANVRTTALSNQRALASRLSAELATAGDLLDRLRALDDRRVALERLAVEVDAPKIYARFVTITDAFSASQRDLGRSARTHVELTRNRTGLIVGALMAMLIVMTLVNIVSLLRPLRRYVAAVERLAEGESAGRLPERRHDEFGDMARAVSRIEERGASARRIRDAIDGSDMLLIVARADGDIVYVSRPMQDLVGPLAADPGTGSPLDWLTARDAGIARAMADGADETLAISLGARHYDVRIRPIAEGNARAGMIVQMIDRTETRRLQHDIGTLVGRVIAGDFAGRIAAGSDGGALGEIAADVNRMCDSFERGFADISATAAALARGDLTHRMTGDYDGMFRTLRDDINRSLAVLSELIGDITLTGAALAGHSDDVAQEADQLSRQTETQAAALRQSSATMREMANAIAVTSERAAELRSLSTGTARGAGEAEGIARAASAAMLQIETAAGRMREIVAVINAISFQTKLLALNAAVEAARAGKAGAGFTVVAAEVRHLADRTARSARDISDLIAESVANVESGSAQVAQTGERLGAIAASVDDMNRAIIAISTMASEQSRSVEEVTAAISAMDDATQHQAGLAEGGAQRARSLQDSARRLQGLIDQFTIGEADRPAEAAQALTAPG